MKVSELIEKLNEVLKERGDIVVWIDASYWCDGYDSAPLETDDIDVVEDKAKGIVPYLMIRK